MSVDWELAELRARIAKAEVEREAWRAAGRQDKYLEAYFMVEALEVELDRLRRQALESNAKSKHAAPVEAPPQPLPAPASGEETPDARQRLMAELSITFAGQQYQYSHYRYDRLCDAVAYARRQILSPSASDAGDSLPPARTVEEPDEIQLRRMATHGITFKRGVYSFGAYRYDHLADALRYARSAGSR